MKKQDSSELFKKRSAGVLLHITSLPCSEFFWADNKSEGPGTLGKEAYAFIDFMSEAGLKIWQMLPVVPTESSPYQALSVHAGNPDLISLDNLLTRGWISESDLQSEEKTLAALKEVRKKCATSFYHFISQSDNSDVKNAFDKFCTDQSNWLLDFALFSALRHHHNQKSWVEWPDGLRKREPGKLNEFTKILKREIDVYFFEQFAFFTQWQELRQYAKERNIYFFGDMPIFVGHDSADVWAQQHYFHLDEHGKAVTVAGVPPDYFSETGQHWGNPHYAWNVMEADGFHWWITRIYSQLQLFDLVRIDHFRAFDAYWEIPGDTQDARLGKWVKAPGEALFKACAAAYPELPLVAENLGLITKDVENLRHKFKLPGMLVLQFAFDGNAENPHLPHNHRRSDLIYTGTHDNDTTLGWYQRLSDEARYQLKQYCFNSEGDMPWLLIQLTFSSVGRVAIIPMQDFLGLDSEHRMNTPGTSARNWSWKFSWDQVDPTLSQRIRLLLKTYQRLEVPKKSVN